MFYLNIFLLILPLIISTSNRERKYTYKNVLADKIICLDPGHGGTASIDSYRKGPTGEREEWINLRVALHLKKLLEKKGVEVLLTRVSDINTSFEDRIKIAQESNADIFLSIHHNATADSTVNFPIIYFHGYASENQTSVILAKEVAKQLKKAMFTIQTPVSVVSDHTIFPAVGTKVLRGTYGIPGIIAEASFFSNPQEELRLKRKSYNLKEAEAFVKALESYFTNAPSVLIAKKGTIVQLEPFTVFQEAERMNPLARMWLENFEQGKKELTRQDATSLELAYELFTRSARSFPDSYIAAQCHRYRASILEKLGKTKEASQEALRAKELYIALEE